MELLNLWVVTVLLSFSNSPSYESHYQAVTFNNEASCKEFLHHNRIELKHDLIHVFEQQKEHFIPEMAKGNVIGCFGLTEPDAGSDPAGMKSIAKKVS